MPRHFLSRCAAAMVIACFHATASFGGPGLIQYQGRLTDPAGNPITTPVTITFTFWSAATGGTQLGGGYYDTDGVTPNSQGLYSTMIGDEPGTKIPDSIFTSPQVWLNVKIGTENLSPRKQLVGVAYAFQSNSSALATTATTAINALHANTANEALSATSALFATHSNYATTATTALSALSAPEVDTLASVAARGASTSKELTLSGGIRTSIISSPSSTGSVNFEDVVISNGIVTIPPVTPPSSITNRLYNYNQGLYWCGTPVMMGRGTAYLYVTTTADPVTNGNYLKTTYDYAKTLKPYGKDLSTSNRLTVLIPPGRYDLTATPLVLNTQFIDIVGVSSVPKDQYLYAKLSTKGAGVIKQSASDVHIENLYVEGTCDTALAPPPAAYYPDSITTKTVVRNCEFFGISLCDSTGRYATYRGRYEDCKSGSHGFGYLGYASGTFIRCEAGDLSFGANSVADGTFIECRAGNDSFGFHGDASGTFERCTGGNRSFAYYGSGSGTFRDCVAANGSFATHGSGNGTYLNCVANIESFGSFGSANGTFIGCKGQDYCFGYAGSANGTFRDCHANSYSFGSGSNTQGGDASGTFTNCTAAVLSFGSSFGVTGPKSYCSGNFVNCVGSSYSFGAHNSDSTNARLQNCRNMFSWSGTWAGRMDNCYFGTGIKCAATARIYGSTFIGALDLNSTVAGVTQSRCKMLMNYGNNVFGATAAAAMIIADPDVQ